MDPHSSFHSKLIDREGTLYMPLGDLKIERLWTKRQLSQSYLARMEALDLLVELRVVKAEVHQQLLQSTHAEFVKVLQRYARVRHPNITAILTMGTYEGHHYTVTEYTAGIPLRERIQTRPLNESDALKILVPIADGLTALWRQDVVHRGVSPYRVLIDNEGCSKLDVVILPRVPIDSNIIEVHAPFMAGFWPPEELRQSADIDARSDMYSFGASLYYALTGISPHGNGSRTELIVRTLTETPRDPREHVPNLHADVCEFILRCLRTDPKARFESTTEFIDELLELRFHQCCQATMRSSDFAALTPPGTSARVVFNPGDTIGQCKLERVVGSGAYGVVFKARHNLLDIPVAVKFLPGELADKSSEYVDLFLREARTAIRIRHKHVIGLYEAGQQGGQYYLMMEFAPNGSVQDRLNRTNGPLPEIEAIRIIKETALGLAAAQELNIIHRDIKPANLMFGAHNEIKVADLGLAKRLATAAEPSGETGESLRAQQLTLMRGEAAMQGTPDYMAPEMAVTPETVDLRADLYSLGVTAYQLATGKLPFEGTTAMQVIMKHVTEPVPPPSKKNPSIAPKFERLILRLMEKRPESRYQTPEELVAALDAL